MKDKLASAYAIKRKKAKVGDLDLEPRASKANLFSNEEMDESPFQERAMSDEEELDESGFNPEGQMDNTQGNVSLDEIMRKLRMRHMGK